ncbi:MAG TPA: RnfABCDGE type electron transport complex subunit D [Limnochordia bacterium]|nr:RnfABCDGE type electron transport complex subunit D [Limnochordia bacterium]
MIVRTGPFLRDSVTVKEVMIDVLIALIPTTIAGILLYGQHTLVVVILSTLSAMLTEALLTRAPLTLKGIFGDGSAAVTGALLGLILPHTTAFWVPILGSVFAIAVVKLAFGGLGHNIFNPALAARALLLLAFTSEMIYLTDAVTGATPLWATDRFSWALVWGNIDGIIGETSVIAILIGAAYLFYKGHINWRIPVSTLGSAFLLAVVWGLDPWYTITAGGLMFAAFFMATDMVTSPVTPIGELVFGAGCGLLTFMIRQYTPFPEGVTFAILIMNALVPAIDSLTIPPVFGVGDSHRTRVQGFGVIAMAVVLLFAALGVVEHSEPSMRPVISDGHYLPIHELLGSSEYDVVDASGIRYYVVRDEEDNPLQATFIAERNGFKGPVRFLIVLDAEHVIKDVTIVKQEESAGFGELITRRSFLDQFTGLEKDSPFTVGDDVQIISGATVSSRAVISGVDRALDSFDQTFFGVDETTGYVDGTYLGQASSFGGPLEVEVVVQGGKIASVTILKHSDTPGFSDPAINGIPDRIVAENNPAVDVASGATVSSEAIMAAVRSALESTSASGFAITVSDGTYQGRAQGFGGTLVLDVVVSGGKITEIVVVESGETPFIANAAFNELIPALIDAQGPVDAISGATVTSGAIHDAVRDALNEKEGQ